jgi:hypothetical protein
VRSSGDLCSTASTPPRGSRPAGPSTASVYNVPTNNLTTGCLRMDGCPMARIAAVGGGLLAANAGEWGVAAVCAVLALLVVFAGDR